MRSLIEEFKESSREEEDFILLLLCCWLKHWWKASRESEVGVIFLFLMWLDQAKVEEYQLTRLVKFAFIRRADVEWIDDGIPSNHGNILIGTIEELNDQDCYEWMRFKKTDLLNLMPQMRLPKFFELTIDERTWELPGEFVFMFSLTLLCKGFSYNDLHKHFGFNRDFMGRFFISFYLPHFFANSFIKSVSTQ